MISVFHFIVSVFNFIVSVFNFMISVFNFLKTYKRTLNRVMYSLKSSFKLVLCVKNKVPKDNAYLEIWIMFKCM